jgi:hypothetical protein
MVQLFLWTFVSSHGLDYQAIIAAKKQRRMMAFICFKVARSDPDFSHESENRPA